MAIPAPIVSNLNALLADIHRASPRVRSEFARDRHALIGASLDLVDVTPEMMAAARQAQAVMEAMAAKLQTCSPRNEHEIEPLRVAASQAVTRLAATFVNAKPSQMTVVLGEGW